MPEFNAQEMLRKLGISTAEEDVSILPSIGMSFGAGSIIAQWTAGIMYWFLTNVDYVSYNQESETKVAIPDIRVPKSDSGWYDMYYSDYAKALNVYHTLHPEAKPNPAEKFRGFRPEVHWVFTAPTATVLNRKDLEKMVQGFGDQILFSARVMALRLSKYTLNERHEFGLMSLPGAVAAVADAYNLPNAGFDLSEFLEEDAKDSMDDEFFVKFCGDPDGDYKDSVLYQRRAALWASLGEDNPAASAIIGAKTASGKPNKQATTSEKLSACLSIAQRKWLTPLYARLLTVPNPMAADNGEHYTIPVLGEIFESEVDARTAAQAELVGDDGEVPVVTGPTHPPLGGWAGGKPEDVVNHITADGEGGSIVSQMANSTPPVRAKLVEDAFVDSWEDLVAWAEYAKEHG